MNITGKLDAQHQHQHEDDEQVEVREVARVARVRLHVADAEEVDQAPHAGDHQQHHDRELIHLERDVDLEVARPAIQLPEVDDQLRSGGAGRLQLEEAGQRDGERGEQHARRRPATPAPFAVGPREGERAVEPGSRNSRSSDNGTPAPSHGVSLEDERGWMHQPCSRLMFCRSTVWWCRKMARMIASPTAASAAATVMTKKTMTWPPRP